MPNLTSKPRFKRIPTPITATISKVQTKHKTKLMPNRRKIGALWSRKTEKGKEYFSGVISDLRGDIQIVVFQNDKKTENQPDYDILLSEPKEER